MNTLRASLLALAAAASSARGAEPARRADKPTLPPLAIAVDSARAACDIVLGHKASLPVPALRGGRAAYRAFFFPLLRRGTELLALHPATLATFAARGGGVECAEFPDVSEPYRKTLGPAAGPAAAGLTFPQFQSRQAELFSLTEQAGMAFSRGESGSEARRAARGFRAAFEALAEPGLGAYYRAASPDFWSWVERVAGKP
ncbi:MAG: hypothetical protein HY554_03075 [Elusimicrobia bacterium]|nr:hypothetical protein [Elusimicrobiota bacterium]